jgi:hypothetical protein
MILLYYMLAWEFIVFVVVCVAVKHKDDQGDDLLICACGIDFLWGRDPLNKPFKYLEDFMQEAPNWLAMVIIVSVFQLAPIIMAYPFVICRTVSVLHKRGCLPAQLERVK